MSVKNNQYPDAFRVAFALLLRESPMILKGKARKLPGALYKYYLIIPIASGGNGFHGLFQCLTTPDTKIDYNTSGTEHYKTVYCRGNSESGASE